MVVITIHKHIVLFALYLIVLTSSQKQKGLIYILQWTCRIIEPESYSFLKTSQESFVSRNCSFQNCFFTANRSYLEILDFDVLVFNIQHLCPTLYMPYYFPPLNRSERQLYVLFVSEPTIYRIPDYYNGFFNLTWAYKTASNIFQPFFVGKNNLGEGPTDDKHWTKINDLAPTNSSIIEKLRSKRIAAAWVASADCGEHHEGFVLARNLRHELSTYGHRIDIYGGCGNMSCTRTPKDRDDLLSNCYKKIETDYYFYLAFDNSFARDYVSEKVLHGLQHFAVPIVFGGADYTGFLPDGSYIDASKLGIKSLAKDMNDIINDPPRYYDFFKWHDYYRFQDTIDIDHREAICAFCAYLNNKKHRLKRSLKIYRNIPTWWNVDDFLEDFRLVTPLSDELVDIPEEKLSDTSSFFSNFFSYLFNE